MDTVRDAIKRLDEGRSERERRANIVIGSIQFWAFDNMTETPEECLTNIRRLLREFGFGESGEGTR